MILNTVPVPKPRMTQRDRWAKRPAVLRYFAFCDALRKEWGDQPVPPSVSMLFLVPMPPSWSKKKREEMVDKPHQTRPDIDNYIKAVLDALCEDDSYVYKVMGEKRWSNLPSIVLTELP